MSISATSPAHALPLKIGDWKHKFSDYWGWVCSHSLVFLASVCAVLCIAAFFIAAGDKIVVGPFSVPKEYEDRGYTSEAVSNAVLELIRGNESTVSIPQPSIDDENAAGGADDQADFEEISANIDGKHVVSSFDQSNIPDIKVPLTSFSLESLIEVLRQTVGRKPTQIAGEIVALKEDSPASVLIRYKIEYPEPSSSVLGYHWFSRRTTTVAGTLTATGAEDVIRKLAHITADGLGRRTLPGEGKRAFADRLVERGDAYFALNDYAKAEDMYELANERQETGHAYLCLGAIAENKGNYKEAADYYEKATRTTHAGDDDDAAWASLYQANLLWRRKRFEEARAKYLEITAGPESPRTFLVRAAAESNLGFLYLFRREARAAAASFDSAQKSTDRLHRYAWNCVHESVNDASCGAPRDKANAQIALDLTNQTMSRIHYGRARILMSENAGPAEVAKELREAVQLNDAHYRAHYQLARTYAQEKNYKKAQEQVEKTIQLAPEFEPAYSYWKNELLKKSDKPLKRALASKYKAWGDSFSQAGNPDEAIDRYCEAASLDSSYKNLCPR